MRPEETTGTRKGRTVPKRSDEIKEGVYEKKKGSYLCLREK